MFGSERICDRCGENFKGEGIFLPTGRRLFCSPSCTREYLQELQSKGELNTSLDPNYNNLGC